MGFIGVGHSVEGALQGCKQIALALVAVGEGVFAIADGFWATVLIIGVGGGAEGGAAGVL